jgi:hypothetical protein
MSTIAAFFVWLAAGSVSRAAEPVFVPDFTPGSPNEFALTVMIQGLVVDQLLKDGQMVLTSAVVAPVTGAPVENCAAREGCPADVLPKIPSRIAIVVQVNRVGETLVGNVELYEAAYADHTSVMYVPIAPGNEHLFANEVSGAARDLLAKLGPVPEETVMAATRLVAVQSAAGAPPSPAPVAPTAPVPVAGTPAAPPIRRYDGSTPHTGDLGPILEGTGITERHLLGAEGSFRKSGLDPRDWVYKATPHAGRLIFEVRAGIALGDTDRLAQLRIETSNGEQTNGWYQEGPVPGRRVRGDGYVGFAPATMFDIGVLAGVQYGQRALTTGVVVVDADGTRIDEQISDSRDISAINFYLQPRARVYLVPLGPAKPFLFTGADIRVFDRYHIDQSGGRVFPAPDGGVIPGWVGGGGMMIDPGPIVGLFAEGMYIRHFGELSSPRQYNDGEPWPHDYQPLDLTSGVTIGVTGGVQFRL